MTKSVTHADKELMKTVTAEIEQRAREVVAKELGWIASDVYEACRSRRGRYGVADVLDYCLIRHTSGSDDAGLAAIREPYVAQVAAELTREMVSKLAESTPQQSKTT